MKNPQRKTLTGYDFTKDPPLPPRKAMREKCLECCAGSLNEVKQCQITDCTLWPYRPGGVASKRKTKRELTPEQKIATAERMKKVRDAKRKI